MPMIATIAKSRLELEQGDVTLQEVDAIVNAANCHLAGGGGVDGAIHRRGGADIMADTRRRYPIGCPTGSAVISKAGKLKALFVIHAVGPRWGGGTRGEPELLRSAYRRSFELAIESGCRSLALPSLSTGAYGYPIESAADIALSTAIEVLKDEPDQLEFVRFVLYGDEAFSVFAATLSRLLRADGRDE
jgi:O-acetyl-ADP-ribose deacetylase (regulator of RNase III)